MDCGAPITLSHGSVLAEDFLAFMEGKIDRMRERCPSCVERWAHTRMTGTAIILRPTHWHCPLDCDKPQPMREHWKLTGLMLCGQCFFLRGRMTACFPCTPTVCGEA